MAFYEDASRIDLLDVAGPGIDRGGFDYNADGTIDIKLIQRTSIPWVWAKRTLDRKCAKWSDIYWEKYGFRSKGCFDCYKVCVALKTLKQLKGLASLQARMGLPSKCGMDKRQYTNCLYSGFWYCPLDGGVDEARRIWARVEKAVKEQVDSSLEVILKRGCTEMELAIGPSDKWTYTEKDEKFEALLDSVWNDPPQQPEQPANLKLHIQKRWVRWAYAHGDSTWKDFVSPGTKLGLEPVTYHLIKGEVIGDARDDESKCKGCKGEDCKNKAEGKCTCGNSGGQGQIALV